MKLCYLPRSTETHKGALRAERRIRELDFNGEEEKKKFTRLGELAEKLQVQISSFILTTLPVVFGLKTKSIGK